MIEPAPPDESEEPRSPLDPLELTDVTGVDLRIVTPVRRIVSLVPSITETVFALGGAAALVGRTRYCIHPKGDVDAIERVGGTKDPRLDRIIALRPDIVLANREENLREHIDALRAAGIVVHVGEPRTPDDALRMVAMIGSMLEQIEAAARVVLAGEAVLHQLEEYRAEREAADALRLKPIGARKLAALIWRDPWMVAGGDTYVSGMLEALGFANAFGDAVRYPEVTVADLVERSPDIILLPSEPYAFGIKDADELRLLIAERGGRVSRIQHCEGEDLMWFGARTPAALGRLWQLLA